MALTVLNVAYPLAPVTPSTAGGAEQVLLQLDRALHETGHRSLVLACSGSAVAGQLIESGSMPPLLDEPAQHTARRAHAGRLQAILERENVDVVHMHGIDFHHYLPPPGAPVLVTLHLPLDWYPADALFHTRPRTWMHCVSAAQHATRPDGLRLLPPVANGVEIPATFNAGRREYALYLGRICHEKGVHLGMQAARLAGVPMIIAGAVFPYTDHIRYFTERIEPGLNPDCRFAGAAGPEAKRALFQNARCVLIPSLVEETSSLAAREALAAGTPVVGFRRAALAAIIEHGRTGYLVDSVEEMAEAIAACARIDPEHCREEARRQFPLKEMTDAYLRLYRRIADGELSRDELE